MQRFESYIAWFRAEASKLPAEDRRAVLAALENRSPREVFLALDPLTTKGRLPKSWDEKIKDFYWTFC
jgi:hypothetical protein